MPRSYTTQTAFTSGELTPLLLGRTDITRYFSGVQTLENFVVQRQGGAQNRSGTRFVGEVKNSNEFTRLIPFEFSVDQTYAMEFGDQYVRFYRYDTQGSPGRLIATGVIENIVSATDLDVTGDYTGIFVDGVTQITIANTGNSNGTFTVASTVFNDPETRVVVDGPLDNSDTTGTFTSDAPVEIASPWTTAQLREIKYTQSADSMLLCHPDVRTQALKRSGPDGDPSSWSIADFANNDGPYAPGLEGPFRFTINPSNNRIQLNNDQDKPFTPNERFIGNPIRIDKNGDGTKWMWATITAVGNNTVGGGNNQFAEYSGGFGEPPCTVSYSQANFRFPAWNDVDGYPHCVTFHQGRLWFGGTDLYPQTVWGSKISAFTSFSPTDELGNQNDDDGVEYTIDDAQVNAISWLESDANGLIIPTSGAIHLLTGGALGDPVTPTNILIRPQILRGSSDLVRPHRLGDVLVTVMFGDRSVREVSFDDNTQRLVGPELTVLSSHIAGTGFFDSDYAEEPQRILWLTRVDGELVGLTIERDQEVVAWHRHVIGGSLDGGQAVAEPVIVIKNLPLSFDQPWLIVKRTIDGVTKRYVETMLPEMTLDQDPTTAVFADSAILYAGAPTTVIAGLDHLEGETVSVRGEGATLTPQTVVGGQITVSPPVTQASVGLPYQPTLKTMPLVLSSGPVDSRAKPIRISRAALLLNRTIGGKVISESEPEELIMRQAGAPMDSPPAVFTGYQNVNPDSSHEQEQTITVIQDEPQPITILALTLETAVDGLST